MEVSENYVKHVLVVDDNKVNLSLAKKALESRYNVTLVISGEQALQVLDVKPVDLILLDVNMPDMDGVETLKRIQQKGNAKNIPVIFLTAQVDNEVEAECLAMGAQDFITKPFFMPTMLSRIEHILELEDLRKNLEDQVRKKTEEIEKITLQAITAVVNSVDAKEVHSQGHSVRVAHYAEEISHRLNWTEDECANLYYVALLHDIGNLGVSDSILSKDGPLTEEEYGMVKKHPEMGAEILKDVLMVQNAMEGAQYHHEWYDGTGYSTGLKGEEIPIVARIIAIAEAYDAMSSERSYRKKMQPDEIKQELIQGKGKQFDPKLVDIMLAMMDDDIEILMGSPTKKEDTSGNIIGESILIEKVLTEYTKGVQSAAKQDALTGLWNRSYTEEEVNKYLKDPRHSGALFMMDMDNFKSINDTYGHIAGDAILIQFAETLKNCIRQDDILCRLGGDEFVIFFKNAGDYTVITKKAEQILRELKAKLRKPDQSEGVTVSIGIALSGKNSNDFISLYRNADKSLYYVKQNGKHSYHFYTDDVENSQIKAVKSAQVDLDNLKRYIEEKDHVEGAYNVEYEGFKKIYRFVSRCIERTNQRVQILLFSVVNKEGDLPDLDHLMEAMIKLKQAVTLSLRRGDVSTGFSSSQYLVILMDADTADGQAIAERIETNFFEEYTKEDIELAYDLRQINKS